MDLREQKFGIEIEMTGLTREDAANVVATHFGITPRYRGGAYHAYDVRDDQSRTWKIVYDSSINAQCRIGGQRQSASDWYKGPICTYATIEPCEGATVPVVLWSISPEDEKMLDLYEGYPKFYGKETMALPLNDNEVTAMVYIMPNHHRLGMPSQHYVDTLLEGYETAGFDPHIRYNALDKTEERMAQEPQQSQQPPLFQQGWW